MLCFTTLQCLPIRPEDGVFLRRVRFKRSILFFCIGNHYFGVEEIAYETNHRTFPRREGLLMNQNNKLTAKTAISALFVLIIAICLLFPAWIGLNFYYADSASLWQIGRLSGNLADLAYEFDLSGFGVFLLRFIPVLIYALLAFSFYGLFVTGRSIFASYKGASKINTLGFIAAGALALLVVLFVAIANAVVNAKTDGWVTDLLKLQAAPVLILILSVAGIIVCKKVPDAAFASLDRSVQSVGASVTNAADTLRSRSAAVQRTCPSCGTVCSDRNAAFCPSCGAKLPTTPKCSGCGKELQPGSKFCPYCGTPAEAAPAQETTNL